MEFLDINQVIDSLDLDRILRIFIWFGLCTAVYMFINFSLKKLQKKLNDTYLSTAVKVVRRIFRGLYFFTLFMTIVAQFVQDREDLEEKYDLVFKLVMIGIVTIVLASISRVIFSNLIDRIERRDEDSTKYIFFRGIAETAIYLLGVLMMMLAIPTLKGYATTLLGGAGILAIIAGFAAQESVSNILAGILIILSKPFKLGDTIKVADNMQGRVWDISLRHTVIRDYDNNMIVIPNSVINKEKLFNYNLGDERICVRINFDISYESDLDLAQKIMVEEALKHPMNIDARNDYEKETGVKRVFTRVVEVGESSIVIKLWTWTHNFDHAFAMKCDLLESIKKRFDLEGIDIPYPHRTITFKDHPIKIDQINKNEIKK